MTAPDYAKVGRILSEELQRRLMEGIQVPGDEPGTSVAPVHHGFMWRVRRAWKALRHGR